MKIQLFSPPWGMPALTAEAGEAISICGGRLWEDTLEAFRADCRERAAAGLRVPKGMQATMNRLLERRFAERGWSGRAGCFRKDGTWVRLTFRHQMSTGSDILEAMRVCVKEGCELAIICVGDRPMLKALAPSEGNSMVSFEGLSRVLEELDGVIDTPLVVGRLVLDEGDA